MKFPALHVYSGKEFFGDDLTQSQRMGLMVEAAAEAIRAAQDAEKSLRELFQSHPAMPLLAAANFHVIIQNQRKPGELEEPLGFTQAHSEFLQALSLRNGYGSGFQQLHIVTHDPLQLGLNAASSTSQIFAGNGFFADIDELEALTGSDLDRHLILAHCWLNAAMVRNFAWPGQLDQVYRAIFGKVEASITGGISASEVYPLLRRVSEIIETKLKPSTLTLMSRYSELLRHMSAGSGDQSSIYGAKQRFFAAFDSYVQAYTVELNEIVEVAAGRFSTQELRNIMSSLSVEIGTPEIERLDYLMVDNFVHLSPYISVAPDRWACFTPGTLHTFRHDHVKQALFSDKPSGDALAGARSSYLEDIVGEWFRKAFPNSQIHPNVKILNERTNTVEGETDLVVVAGQIVLIVECKSASIDRVAQRGSKSRVSKWMNDNAVGGTLQARRMELTLSDPKSKMGKEVDKIRQQITNSSMFAKLVVCIEPPPFTSSRSSTLLRAGIIEKPIAPVLSLFGLDVVSKLIDRPYQVAHYLLRRCQWEEAGEIEGDEIDLLGLYLLAPQEGLSGEPTIPALLSLEVDKALNLPIDQRPVNWPAFPIRPFWDDIVSGLWDSDDRHVAIKLLDVDHNTQKKILKKCEKLRSKAERLWGRQRIGCFQHRVSDTLMVVAGIEAETPSVTAEFVGCCVVINPLDHRDVSVVRPELA